MLRLYSFLPRLVHYNRSLFLSFNSLSSFQSLLTLLSLLPFPLPSHKRFQCRLLHFSGALGGRSRGERGGRTGGGRTGGWRRKDGRGGRREGGWCWVFEEDDCWFWFFKGKVGGLNPCFFFQFLKKLIQIKKNFFIESTSSFSFSSTLKSFLILFSKSCSVLDLKNNF